MDINVLNLDIVLIYVDQYLIAGFGFTEVVIQADVAGCAVRMECGQHRKTCLIMMKHPKNDFKSGAEDALTGVRWNTHRKLTSRMPIPFK